MDKLTLLEQLFEREGSLAVAYVSILTLINIRNMHLSKLARIIGDRLSNYTLTTDKQLQKNEIILNKAYQIKQFTKRYRDTGYASLALITIVPLYALLRLLDIFFVNKLLIYIFICLCGLLFMFGAGVLIWDLLNGTKTLHANNLLANVVTSKDTEKLKNEIDPKRTQKPVPNKIQT